MGLGLGGSGPRGIAAFAPNRHDLPTTLPGGQADDDAELSENDEPVWGRATLKKISKERVETLKKQKSVPGGVGFALVGSSGYESARPLSRAHRRDLQTALVVGFHRKP